MTSKIEKNIDQMVKTSLNQYGIGKKPEPEKKDLLADKMDAFYGKRKSVPSSPNLDMFERPKPRRTSFARTNAKTDRDPDTIEGRTDTMLIKLDVRRAELERICRDAQDPTVWDAPKSKSHVNIARNDWEDITVCIAKFVGQVMDASALEWKSGHEWSIERGNLVRHISQYIQENAVHRGVYGKRTIKVEE